MIAVTFSRLRIGKRQVRGREVIGRRDNVLNNAGTERPRRFARHKPPRRDAQNERAAR